MPLLLPLLSTVLGLHIADIVALAVYFIGITALGIWSSRYVKTMADFVMPRRFGKWMMMMHGFGTSTHADQAVSVASKTFTNGVSGIWYSWMWLFATPFYWFIAPMMRRFRALTTADVFEARYDRSVAMLYAALGLLKFMVNIGLMLKGSATVIEACTLGALPVNATIIVMTLLFVAYGIAGGLSAAIVTDFVQGILTILFSFLLLPFAFRAVGGMAGMKESIPALVPDKDMFSLVAPGEIGVFFIIMIAINALAGVVVQPQNMGTCAAGRSERDGAIGFMGGNLIKRVCTVAWCFTGLAAVAHYQGVVEDPDLVYGQMAREFLPALMPGLLGIFIAALLATVMGSCDSFMIASSGLITENLYKPLVPGRGEKHYLTVARISALVVVAGGVALAYLSEGVVALLENLWKVNSLMGAAFWLGVFWRRTTPAGAWAATIGTGLTWWLTTWAPVIAFIGTLPGADALGFVTESPSGAAEVYLPWQMLFYLSIGLVSGIIASLLTRRIEAGKLEAFYALLRTPVTPGETVPKPCALPEGAITPPRRVFFPNTDFELPIPGRSSLTGFFVGWLCVGAIIGGVALWLKLE